MSSRHCLAPAAWLWLASAGSAFAAEDAPAHWALELQRFLLRFGVWQTGLHRLDDGSLFGLACCVILTAFMSSAAGLLIFKARGANFTVGWLVGLPVAIAAMLLYCRYKPYPAYDDLSWMFIAVGAAQLAALALIRILRGMLREDQPEAAQGRPEKSATPPARSSGFGKAKRGGPHARQAPAPDPQLMRDRMKLATRGGPSKS